MSEGPDPVRDTCSLTGHTGLVVGDKLYIQGGRMIYNRERGWDTYGQNPYLRILHLNSTIRALDVASNIEVVQSRSAPYFYDPFTIQDTRTPLFWLDSVAKKVYLGLGAELSATNLSYIGGRDYNPGRKGKIWTANLKDENVLADWTESNFVIGGQNANLLAAGANYFDQEKRTGFIFGGSPVDGDEFPQPINQLLTFDAETGRWINDTTPFLQSSTGWLHGITLEDRIVLLAGMGATDRVKGVVDIVRIYDTKSKQWYSQRTNGSPPENRFFAGCSIIIPAPDKSSYQIIIYGGANDEKTFGDVWALSIPSFTWTKLSDDVESVYAPQWRYSPVCKLMKKHMLVVFGGNRLPEGRTLVRPNCDLEGRLAWFFDLNTLEWKNVVEAEEKEEYVVPQMIWQEIGGGAQGGATVTQPPGGFIQPAMSTVFAAFASRTSTSDPASTTSSSNTSTASPRPRISDGAVGGIVAGVVLGLLLISLGVWFFFLRRKNPFAPPPAPFFDSKGTARDPSELQAQFIQLVPRKELHGDSSTVTPETQPTQQAMELQGDTNHAELPGSTPRESEGSTDIRQIPPRETV